jgi:DNA-directed RNA polymerase subunit beta'
LVDVAQDAIITEYDCGTLDGIEMGALVEGARSSSKMEDRILGRVALFDILDPVTASCWCSDQRRDHEDKVEAIVNSGIRR